MNSISASIVIYKNSTDMLAQAIKSFLSSAPESKLYLIDNSPTDNLKCLAYDPRIVYVFTNRNIGFGAGHNLCLREIIDKSKYHLILNPDVYFNDDVIKTLYLFLENNPNIGQVMPKVLYPNGQLQKHCKLLPSPKTLIMRRFLRFLKPALSKENQMFELQASGYNKIIDVPFLSGCFMMLRTEALKKSGLFDERFFLYTEDTDLTRRIHMHYRTVYFPETTIYHHHARGSTKNLWLLLLHIQSTVKYFNKWGWFNDDEREMINQRILIKLGS